MAISNWMLYKAIFNLIKKKNNNNNQNLDSTIMLHLLLRIKGVNINNFD